MKKRDMTSNGNLMASPVVQAPISMVPHQHAWASTLAVPSNNTPPSNNTVRLNNTMAAPDAPTETPPATEPTTDPSHDPGQPLPTLVPPRRETPGEGDDDLPCKGPCTF